MNTLVFVMILCTGSSWNGKYCVVREYKTLDQCKAFIASAESQTEDKKGMAAMKGVCVAEDKK